MTTNKHIGSDFDEFLAGEGLLAEAEATAVKRIIAYQIRQEMEARHISKSELAEMMKTSRPSLSTPRLPRCGSGWKKAWSSIWAATQSRRVWAR